MSKVFSQLCPAASHFPNQSLLTMVKYWAGNFLSHQNTEESFQCHPWKCGKIWCDPGILWVQNETLHIFITGNMHYEKSCTGRNSFRNSMNPFRNGMNPFRNGVNMFWTRVKIFWIGTGIQGNQNYLIRNYSGSKNLK